MLAMDLESGRPGADECLPYYFTYIDLVPNDDIHNVLEIQQKETLALLKILALGNRQIEEGKVVAAADVIGRLRAKNKRAG